MDFMWTHPVQNSVDLIITYPYINNASIGDCVSSAIREIPFHGSTFQLHLYPAGATYATAGVVCVDVLVEATVRMEMDCYSVDPQGVRTRLTSRIIDYFNFDTLTFKICLRNQLQEQLHHQNLSFHATVWFDIPIPTQVYGVNNSMILAPSNFTLITTDGTVKVNRDVVKLSSNLFCNMMNNHPEITHLTIAGFASQETDYVMDYCHNRGLPNNMTVTNVIKMLQFGQVYNMVGVVQDIEKSLRSNFTPDTFTEIATYAFEYSRESLLYDCSVIISRYNTSLIARPDFLALPVACITAILTVSENPATDIQLWKRALNLNLNNHVDQMEVPFLIDIPVNRFCDMVNYAWNFMRGGLLDRCYVEFQNDEKRFQIMALEEYHLLPQIIREALLDSLVVEDDEEEQEDEEHESDDEDGGFEGEGMEFDEDGEGSGEEGQESEEDSVSSASLILDDGEDEEAYGEEEDSDNDESDTVEPLSEDSENEGDEFDSDNEMSDSEAAEEEDSDENASDGTESESDYSGSESSDDEDDDQDDEADGPPPKRQKRN